MAHSGDDEKDPRARWRNLPPDVEPTNESQSLEADSSLWNPDDQVDGLTGRIVRFEH